MPYIIKNQFSHWKTLGNQLRTHQHSEKVNINNPIPKRRAVEDSLEMNTIRTTGPSVNPSSARIKELPTRPMTASYITSYFPRAQIAHENRNYKKLLYFFLLQFKRTRHLNCNKIYNSKYLDSNILCGIHR